MEDIGFWSILFVPWARDLNDCKITIHDSTVCLTYVPHWPWDNPRASQHYLKNHQSCLEFLLCARHSASPWVSPSWHYPIKAIHSSIMWRLLLLFCGWQHGSSKRLGSILKVNQQNHIYKHIYIYIYVHKTKNKLFGTLNYFKTVKKTTWYRIYWGLSPEKDV